MFDLRQTAKRRASAPQNIRETSNAVEISVAEKNPFWLGFSRSNPPETDTNIFAQVFCRDKPWIYRVIF